MDFISEALTFLSRDYLDYLRLVCKHWDSLVVLNADLLPRRLLNSIRFTYSIMVRVYLLTSFVIKPKLYTNFSQMIHESSSISGDGLVGKVIIYKHFLHPRPAFPISIPIKSSKPGFKPQNPQPPLCYLPVSSLQEALLLICSHMRNCIVESLFIDAHQNQLPHTLVVAKDILRRHLDLNCQIVRLLLAPTPNPPFPVPLQLEISWKELLKVSRFNGAFRLHQSVERKCKIAPLLRKRMSIISSTIHKLTGRSMRMFPFWSVEMHSSVSSEQKQQSTRISGAKIVETAWDFVRDFPEALIRLFQNSPKDAWPERLVLAPCSNAIYYLCQSGHYNFIERLSRKGKIVDYIWPSVDNWDTHRNGNDWWEIPHGEDSCRVLNVHFIDLFGKYNSTLFALVFTTE